MSAIAEEVAADDQRAADAENAAAMAEAEAVTEAEAAATEAESVEEKGAQESDEVGPANAGEAAFLEGSGFRTNWTEAYVRSVLTEEEYAKYKEFVARADPEGKQSVRHLARGFIMCKCDVENALAVGQEFDRLWSHYEPLASREDLLKEVRTGKMRFGGHDKKGRRIVHFHYALHDPKAQSLDCTCKFFFTFVDVLADDIKALRNGALFVCWMENSGWSNFDLPSEIRFIELYKTFVAQDVNILEFCIMVNSPWYVKLAEKLVFPFLSEKLAKMYCFMTLQELHGYHPQAELEENDYFERYLEAGVQSNFT
mmetsp:Transcript_14461/g.56857  ORF Transcript_14461/g.56857 Transcript_14461/m.56857 type:complete len:312 (+) Transcript_14461:39-974(+)